MDKAGKGAQIRKVSDFRRKSRWKLDAFVATGGKTLKMGNIFRKLFSNFCIMEICKFFLSTHTTSTLKL